MKERKPTVSMRAAQEHRRRERVAWQAGYDKAVADMLERGESTNTARHDETLPWNHPDQHSSHRGGCICIMGSTPLRDESDSQI